MRKYRVMVRGENVWMRVEKTSQHLGFYTMRFVEAASVEEAKQRAVQLVREDPRLVGMVLIERSDPPTVSVEEIAELASFDNVASSATGFTFYPEAEKGEAEVRTHRLTGC